MLSLLQLLDWQQHAVANFNISWNEDRISTICRQFSTENLTVHQLWKLVLKTSKYLGLALTKQYI